MLQNVRLALLVLLYLAAGINHFLHPGFYEAIMPPFLPQPRTLVYVSGVIEVLLGLMLLFTATRLWAARLIAVMLVVFIPVHVYMLQQAYAVPGYKTTVAAAWVRLLVQPLLILWVLWEGGKSASAVRDGRKREGV